MIAQNCYKMSRLLGDTAIAAAQTTVVRLNRVPRPLSSKGYCLRPAPPPEKKWLYKQVLESVQSGISPQLNLANSTLGRATSQAWVQLNVATQRAQLMANEYHLKQRLGYVMKQVACCVVAVKDFFAQKQYYQLDRIIDKGLLALEETIRAAFANNIAGGFSTAIAVFCHELPHELGDFAVLLKAGMSAREAVYYNLLSSLLSLLGMVLGIIVGHQPEASSWVFAVAAGMFLYIALVDMVRNAGFGCGFSKVYRITYVFGLLSPRFPSSHHPMVRKNGAKRPNLCCSSWD